MNKGKFMSKNPQTLRLFIRFIVGEATEKEKQKIERWLENDGTNRQLMQTLDKILHESQLEPKQWDEDELWNKFAFKAGMTLSQADSPDEFKQRSNVNIVLWPFYAVMQLCFGINRSPAQYVFRLAVIVLLILGGSMGTAVYFKKLLEKRELAYQSTYQEYSTQKGERSTLILSDGTSIRFN